MEKFPNPNLGAAVEQPESRELELAREFFALAERAGAKVDFDLRDLAGQRKLDSFAFSRIAEEISRDVFFTACRLLNIKKETQDRVIDEGV